MSTHAIPLGRKCPHRPIFIGGGGKCLGGICPYTKLFQTALKLVSVDLSSFFHLGK